MKDLKEYFSEDEKKTLEEYERKMKAVRDKAIERRKADIKFWRQVDDRLDEVYEYILEKRKERNAVKPTNAYDNHNANIGAGETTVSAVRPEQNRGGFGGVNQQ